MNFADYFVKGLRNTLRLKKGINWSVKGSEIPIPTDTIIDTWFVGEFSNAVYEVVAEYGKNDVEYVSVKISARPEQASVIVSGRNNNGKDLVSFSATVDASKVIVVASPFFQDDGVTPLEHVKLTFKVTYYERLTPTYIPTLDGESSNTGGELGVYKGWNNTNVADGFMAVNENGSIAVSNIGNIQVVGQSSLVPDFILTKLNITNTDQAVTLTTTSNSLSLNLNNIANLNVTNSFSANTNSVSVFNNANIGNSTPLSGTFTQLTANTVFAISNNQQISLAPTGTGTVTVSPATAGSINNVAVGNSTPKSAAISNLTANQTVNLTSSNQTITIGPTGAGTVNMNPTNIGSADNVTVGSTTPAAGRFTTITVLNTSTQGNQLIALSQLKSILLGAAV